MFKNVSSVKGFFTRRAVWGFTTMFSTENFFAISSTLTSKSLDGQPIEKCGLKEFMKSYIKRLELKLISHIAYIHSTKAKDSKGCTIFQ